MKANLKINGKNQPEIEVDFEKFLRKKIQKLETKKLRIETEISKLQKIKFCIPKENNE